MVTHIVLFKLAPPIADNASALRDKLLAMQGRIPGLRRVEVGRNRSTEARASDLALITQHDSWADLEAYATHPVHLEVIAFAKPRIERSTVVDTEDGIGA